MLGLKLDEFFDISKALCREWSNPRATTEGMHKK